MKYETARQILAEALEQLDEGPEILMMPQILRAAHRQGKLPIGDDWRNDPTVHPYWKERWSRGGNPSAPWVRTPPERINPFEAPSRPDFDPTPDDPYGQGNDNPIHPGSDPNRPGAAPRKPNENFPPITPSTRPRWMGRSTYDYYPGHPIVRDPRAPPPPGWLPPPMWKPQTSLNEGKVKTLNKSKKRAFMVYEGAYKGAMEDWLTSLPKPVIDELKTKHGKELAHTGGDGYRDIATKKTLPLHKSIVGILKKHKVKPFAHSVHDSSHAIQMSFHTYHG